MNNAKKVSIVIQFDERSKKLDIFREGGASDLLSSIDLNGIDHTQSEVVENTLGQMILYQIDRMTDKGVGFGDYKNILERISKENLDCFIQSLDSDNADDVYSLALLIFSHGRRKKSLDIVKKALSLFEKSAHMGNGDSIKFLSEEWPIVKDRIEQYKN